METKQRFLINSDKEYREAMNLIYELMDKGEANLTEAEIEKLKTVTIEAEKYEDKDQ